MKNIENILDNNYLKLEYLDAEIIVENDDGHDLARIAHEVNDKVGNLTDVGASYRAAWLDVLNKEYYKLDVDEMLEVITILEDNYGGKDMECPHKEYCNECTDEECLHGCHDCGYFDGGNCIHSGCNHLGCYGGECACDCSEWNDGRY